MTGILGQAPRFFLAGLVLLAAALFSDRASAEDSYLLALAWQPSFCADQTHAGFAECKLAAQEKPRLVLHGLWPDWDVNGDGKRNGADAFCIPDESARKSITALDKGNWLKLPAVKLSGASASDLALAMPGAVAGLDRHEWWKHGTCSQLEADEYFAISVALLREFERRGLARLLLDSAGGTVQRKQLLDVFELDFGPRAARALQLDCDAGGATLQEIRVRLNRERVTQGLTAQTLAVPPKPPRGNCAAEIQVPNWPD